jgi:hypothetical protein
MSYDVFPTVPGLEVCNKLLVVSFSFSYIFVYIHEVIMIQSAAVINTHSVIDSLVRTSGQAGKRASGQAGKRAVVE